MIGSQNNSYGTPLSLREWLVCIFATLTLVFTAWSLGGYKTWALHLLFAGGLGTFLASVLPMPRSWNGYDQQHGNLKNFKRLLAQPFFWASMCFLVYILTQYLNPSIVQVLGEKSWWVEPMSPPLGANLPSSVKADYEEMNALRTLVIQASAISLACGILVGIQRRKSALIILWFFVISGVTMAFVAILQKLSGADKILWVVNVQNVNPWGTFAYRNQGAAFLILVFLITGLLYFLYEKRASIKLKLGGPHLFLLLCTFLLTGSIWLSLSRGGIILSLLMLSVFILLALINVDWSSVKHNLRKLFLLSTVCGILAWFFVLNLSDWQEIEKRWNNLEKITLKIEDYDRYLCSKATFDMAQDQLMYGWGAGSFRYIFPIYQTEYEGLLYFYDHRNMPYGRKIYNYAHNDWIQFLAEYGIIGTILMGCLFFSFMANLRVIFKVSRTSACFMMFGIMIVVIHNFVDFIFSSPSYWVAFWGCLFLVYQLYKLQSEIKGIS